MSKSSPNREIARAFGVLLGVIHVLFIFGLLFAVVKDFGPVGDARLMMPFNAHPAVEKTLLFFFGLIAYIGAAGLLSTFVAINENLERIAVAREKASRRSGRAESDTHINLDDRD